MPYETITVAIGRLVRERRNEKRWTQQQLADWSNASITSVNRLEKGHSLPHPRRLNRIGRVLNLKLGRLQ